mmetsp:Transcript_4144/g.7167  ORF Transcript_4144/g.7167 Transcript_4144/m.7167 type:complete len:119 (-) Transcript_4144:368-724(-)
MGMGTGAFVLYAASAGHESRFTSRPSMLTSISLRRWQRPNRLLNHLHNNTTTTTQVREPSGRQRQGLGQRQGLKSFSAPNSHHQNSQNGVQHLLCTAAAEILFSSQDGIASLFPNVKA